MSKERLPLDETFEPSPSKRNDNAVVKALLRIYAMNRRRSWRNSQHAAFLDATIQLEVLSALTLTLIFSIAKIILGGLFFPSFGRLNSTFISLALVIPIIWILDQRLKPYEFIPNVEKAYDTARDRIIANTYYVSGSAILGLGLYAAYSLRKVFPSQFPVS